MVFEAARWKLEKGATLGLLEQLIGSRTVGSTFTTQIGLGRFNLLGLVLLLLWAFSPLGSQAALRALDSKLEPVNSTSNVLYFSTDAENQLASDLPISPQSSLDDSRAMGHIKNMFAALFLTSEERKTDPMDLWGNVKIPNLNIQDDQWHNVPSHSSPDSFSALLGLPVTNVTKGNVTFSLESSYLHLACWNLTRTNRSLDIWPSFNWTDPDLYGGYNPKPNGTWHGRNDSQLQSAWSMAVDRFVGPDWSVQKNLSARLDWVTAQSFYGRPSLFINETDLIVKPSRLLFLSEFRDGPNAASERFKAHCNVLQRYVESRVHCSRVDTSAPQNCSVIAQRLSQKQHATENITMLSWERVWSRVSSLPGLMGGARNYADITMRYINNPRLNAISGETVKADGGLLNSTIPEQFGRRLAQVLNSYLLVGQVYNTAMQGDSNFNSKYNVTTPAEVGNLVEVYNVHWSWVSLFLMASLILLASGIVSIAFAHLAIGPETLGYASAVVRDSKYMNLPAEAGKKEAFEVVKMMGQKRLRYGYVDLVAEDGQPLVGVGLESETGDIHKS
ncbi:hypothetical protein LB507_001444 [Fusarium sp. FIESC RH6]|nr:hypothetical protein LB507_001444 [Fusarium sp. FIESC RH6]